VRLIDDSHVKIEYRREQYHAVEIDAFLLEAIGHGRRARRAIALADQELRRVPASILREEDPDELGERFRVGVHAIECFGRAHAPGVSSQYAAESRAHRVDEHEIAGI